MNELTKRTDVLSGKTFRAEIGCGKAYITVNVDEAGAPMEVFCQVGKSGQCARVQTAVICKLISHSLRSGRSAEKIMLDMLGETCSMWDGADYKPRSCSDAIGRALGYFFGKFDDKLKLVEQKTEVQNAGNEL